MDSSTQFPILDTSEESYRDSEGHEYALSFGRLPFDVKKIILDYSSTRGIWPILSDRFTFRYADLRIEPSLLRASQQMKTDTHEAKDGDRLREPIRIFCISEDPRRLLYILDTLNRARVHDLAYTQRLSQRNQEIGNQVSQAVITKLTREFLKGCKNHGGFHFRFEDEVVFTEKEIQNVEEFLRITLLRLRSSKKIEIRVLMLPELVGTPKRDFDCICSGLSAYMPRLKHNAKNLKAIFSSFEIRVVVINTDKVQEDHIREKTEEPDEGGYIEWALASPEELEVMDSLTKQWLLQRRSRLGHDP